MGCRLFLSIFIFGASLLSALSSHAKPPAAGTGVWTASAMWSEAEEEKYAEWIRTEFTEDFFLKGPWGDLKTDCADAMYGARIVFSYLHSLPFALDPKNPKFDNRSTAFSHIVDPVKRVRAFIEAVNNRTWTGSLSRHTYPIEISRSSIVPGTMWMKPGHVEMVRGVSPKGVVELRGSWLPAAIREMISITTLGHVPVSKAHGFRRWIWPQNLDRAVEQQPKYSDTQFVAPVAESQVADSSSTDTHFDQAMEIRRFDEDVQRRLALRNESAKEKIERRARDFCKLVQVRFDVVRSGFEYYSRADRCLNESEYFAYSTPSRDAGLRRLVMELGFLLGNDLGKVQKVLAGCTVPNDVPTIIVGPSDFFRNVLTLDFSSDPHELPSVRFGDGIESSPCRR